MKKAPRLFRSALALATLFLAAAIFARSASGGFHWGQYRSTASTWVASDAELEVDPGVGLMWFSSDFEREDDVAVPSTQPVGIDCRTFPLGSYALEDLSKGSGNIQVKP